MIYGVVLNDAASLQDIGPLDGAPYNGAPKAPVLYIKPPNTVVGNGAAVALPQGATRVEIGATIGVVLGREVSRIAPQAVPGAVSGYAVVADLSLPHASYYRPAIHEKCFDGACPVGSQIVPADQAGALSGITLRTFIDGKLAASRGLADLVRDVPALIAQISDFMTLCRGDMVLVGVPWQAVQAGIGAQVRVEAGRIGSVAFSITAPLELAQEPAHGWAQAGAAIKRGRIAWQGAIHEVTPAEAGRVRLADGRIIDESECVWLPPVSVSTVFALGLNYADHAKELAFKAPRQPLVFLKGPGTVIGHRSRTRRPRDATYMHYECELAVVIGRTGYRVNKDQAMNIVAGYTVANDYAIRDYLENYYRPNLRVKNRDGCTPLGPWLVARDAIADPMQLALTTRINGRVTQTGTTADMIFDIPTLIEYLSSFMTLSPGDVILTGTPEGLADVKAGDVVETEIEGVGCLVNTVVDDETFFTNIAD